MSKYYYIISYGCQMNASDSEKIAAMLETLGYSFSNDMSKCNILVFNTCCVRKSAENRAFNNIAYSRFLKKNRDDLIIVVCGCIPQKRGNTKLFAKNYPHVDIVLGTHTLDKLPYYLYELKKVKNIYDTSSKVEDRFLNEDKKVRKSHVSALVKIMTGCDNYCSYCIVPYVRGHEASRSNISILEECADLIDKGYKEITLVGQNVNSYLFKNVTFVDLLKDIASLKGKFRLKFMTSHPKDLSPNVIDVVANYDNMAKYIHLPIQSGNNRILELMNRNYTREQYLEIIKQIRRHNISISTDIMVGFPTETEDEFQDTMNLVKEVRFDNIYSFIYSPREGTKACSMDGQIDILIKKRRVQELIDLKREISNEQSAKLIGKRLEVLAIGNNHDNLLARSNTEKMIYVANNDKKIGEFFEVNIIDVKNSNLIGEVV